ncbi:hypothetical protein OTU49_002769, partial [Cherax quadricarinatus]
MKTDLTVRLMIASVVVCGTCQAAVDMVRLWRAGGSTFVTSSTLAWVSDTDKLPEHAVPISLSSSTGPYWCRGRHRGTYVPGSFGKDNICVIPFLKGIHHLDKFDILVSLNGSARLHLQPWDGFMAKPDNAILSPNMMLAVAPLDSSPEAALMAGHVGLGMKDRRAILIDDDTIRRVEKANIVVEEEPVSYSLGNIVLDDSKDTMTEHKVLLKTVTMENPGEEDEEVSKLVTYEAREKQYWGRVKGTVTALRAIITNPKEAPVAMPSPEKPLTLMWGINNNLARADTITLVHTLPAGVGVEVELEGRVRHYEAPYTATLTAHYADSTQQARNIVSLHTHEALVAVAAMYKRYYYIENGTDIEMPEVADI